MTAYLLIFPLLVFGGEQGWKWHDQAALGFAAGCQLADLIQTDWALEHGYRETNSLLGDSPSDSTLAALTVVKVAAHWYLGETEADYRTPALLLSAVPCVLAVRQNYRNGIRP